MSNLFTNFTVRYFDNMTSLAEANRDAINNRIDSIIDSDMRLFRRRRRYLKLDNSEELVFDFEYIKSITDINCDTPKYLDLVKQFAEFLRFAEKCFMYNNSDDSEVRIYSELDPKTSTTIIYFNPLNIDAKIRIAFQDSNIDMPNRNGTLTNFIEGDSRNQNDKVQFIQIDIQREFGKEMKNEYKFVLGSAIPIKDDSDIILYNSIKFITSEMVFECFIDIINNYMMKMININSEALDVKDIIYNGIRIR